MVAERNISIVLIGLRTPDTSSVNLYSIIGFPAVIIEKTRTEMILFIREKCMDFIFIYEYLYYIIIMWK